MIAYIVGVATVAAITAILCLGVNVSWGWVGQLDLAYYVYVALGAYFAMVLELPPSVPQPGLDRGYILGLHWPFIPSVIVAAIVGGLVALVVGAIALRRLRGDYVAIITIVAAFIVTAVLSQDSTLFGGQIGVYGVSSPLNSVLHLNPNNYSYFFLGLSVVVLALTYLCLEVLYRSPFGRSLRAVREEPTAAAAFGRNLFSLRLRAYVLGGTVGALGGALFANYIGAWNPASWNLIEVVLLMSGVLVGGRANSRGVILGSVIVLSIIPEVTRLVPILGGNADVGPAIGQLIAALLIVVIMRWRPAGILPERKTMAKAVVAAGQIDGAPALTGGAARPAATDLSASVTPAGEPAPEAAPIGVTVSDLSAPAGALENPAAERVRAEDTSRTLLEVQDLSKHYGGVRAVDGASFAIPQGRLYGLIGPNGAGKSTVVELISGLVKADAGSIRFDGRELVGLRPHQIYAAGLTRCFQLAKEWPQLTVLENLLIAAPVAKRDRIVSAFVSRRRLATAERHDRDRALATLDKYNLYALRNDYARTLSGGQKRLLEFARIAMSSPKLALLDEPMAGVNPVLQVQVEAGIRSLLASGTTILLIEHNLGFVERLCDHVIVMVQGRVVAQGSMEDVRQSEAVQVGYLGETTSAG